VIAKKQHKDAIQKRKWVLDGELSQNPEKT
jgi:hypothetical protein